MLPKIDDLAAVCLTSNPDVICIVESWLCADISDNEIFLPSYYTVRLDRNRHGGGIIMYIKDHINYNILHKGPSDLEFIFVSLYLCNNRSLYLGAFYRPPSSPISILNTFFDVLCSFDYTYFSNLIIVGDFNVDLSSNTSTCKHLNNVMHSFSLSQVVTEPTHFISENTSSLIDLVLMSAPEHLKECVTVPPLSNSDHSGISIRLETLTIAHHKRQQKRSIWRYSHADFSTACELLDEINFDHIFASSSIDECWQRWKETFLKIMDICIPKSTLPTKRSLPWISKEIVQMIKKRNYYHRRYKQSNLLRYHAAYKRTRNKVITLLRHSKLTFFKKLHPKSNKAFWKAVNSLNRKSSGIPTITSGSLVATTDGEKAELLNEHFTQCFNYFVEPLQPCYSHTLADNKIPSQLLCTVDEVYHLLSSLDPAKATGPDLVSARMLKHTATSISPAVTRLFNMSLSLGSLPSEWKSALVVPIPKSQHKSDPSNYRPISLLPILSKLLEKHIHAYLMDRINTSSYLSGVQWGFLKGKSTTGALLTAIHDWHQALEIGIDVCAIFLDLSKAFDKVPHIPLLSKLAELNIPQPLLNWFYEYLCQRLQRVVVKGESSISSHVISGVPQGSVLGPLLFLIYINEITQIPLNNGTHLLLYADDILLYRRINNDSDYYLLQQDIDTMETWLLQNYLQLNAAKCKYMTIPANTHHHSTTNSAF